jgi:hypothetical protein
VNVQFVTFGAPSWSIWSASLRSRSPARRLEIMINSFLWMIYQPSRSPYRVTIMMNDPRSLSQPGSGPYGFILYRAVAIG